LLMVALFPTRQIGVTGSPRDMDLSIFLLV